MTQNKPDWQQSMEALSRQYLDAWQSFANHATQQMGAGLQSKAAPDWTQAFKTWPSFGPLGKTDTSMGALLEQFASQTRGFFGLMNQLGEQLRNNASAAEITAAWKKALGEMTTGNPMQSALRGIGSLPGMSGIAGALPDGLLALVAALRNEWHTVLSLPAFGSAREHQERWQQLAAAQLEYQQQLARFQTLLSKVSERAFAIFENKLAERSEPGRQIDSLHGLFDLWIDAAEAAYSEVALSDEFRSAYGALTNAQMRVKAGIQGEIERITGELGIPSRAEVDSSHRRVHKLEREMRALRERLERLEGNPPPATTPSSSASVRAAPAGKARQAGKTSSAKSSSKPKPAPAKRAKAAGVSGQR